MSPRIKICGLRSQTIVESTLQAGADLIGFAHFSKSPRHLTLAEAGTLIEFVKGRAETVLLTVNPSDDLVERIAVIRPDWLQLHGAETAERISQIRKIFPGRILKAIPIAVKEDLDQIAALAEVADLMLLDAKPPKNSQLPGGNGEVFDWSVLEYLDPSMAYMLSGGLTPDNVAAAAKQLRPFALDVSTGVESSRGVKDAGLIKSFIDNVRSVAQLE